MYNLLHDRSPILLDYSSYDFDELRKYPAINKIESVWTSSKLDSPVTCYLHNPGTALDKITALYPAQQMPSFAKMVEFPKFKELEMS